MLLGKGKFGVPCWSCSPRDPTPDKRTKMDGWMDKSIEDLVKHFMFFEGSDQQVATLSDNTQSKFHIQEITELEVIDIITALNNSKAKDIYGLDTSFIKSNKEALAPPTMHLVNLSIKNSIVPKAWKLASVFTAGDKSDINNYRPISIFPIISKIIEKWVIQQIIEFLSNSQTSLHPMLFGFRPRYSTEAALALFMEKIKCQLDKNGCVGAVSLDF